jgi:hypothetical protein
MRWRRISEQEVMQALDAPERVETTEPGRYSVYRRFGERLLKVTYSRFGGGYLVITAVWKGE